MRTIICSLILVCVLSLSGIAQDCPGNVCPAKTPVRSTARVVVTQPIKLMQQTKTFAVKAAKRGWNLSRLRKNSCCGCAGCCN